MCYNVHCTSVAISPPRSARETFQVLRLRIVRCLLFFFIFRCLSLVLIVFHCFAYSPWYQKTDRVLEEARKFCLCSTFGCFLSKKNWRKCRVLIVSVSGKRKWLTWRNTTTKKKKHKEYFKLFAVQSIMQRQGTLPIPGQTRLLHRKVWPPSHEFILRQYHFGFKTQTAGKSMSPK